LGVSSVGTNQDFFELGGDSILSVQLVARAHERGLRLTPRQVFEHRTIAELARVAQPRWEGAQTAGTELPLSAGQAWFFATPMAERGHWNQAVVVAGP